MEPMIKGYIVEHTGRFILEDPGVRPRVDPALVRKIEQSKVAKAGWYRRSEQVELWRAIAASQPDEKSAYDALVRSGEFVGSLATTTFLKLLFRVLTPRMFASKFPDLFKRDHQGGEACVEEISENRVVLVTRNIAGFDHFGPNTVGFARIAFGAMGLKNIGLTCAPWSLAEPGPNEVRFVCTWG